MLELINYEELIKISKEGIPYEFSERKNLKFIDRKFPWSIKEEEFKTIYRIIKDRNLKNGFEICTGIGISGLAAGLAFNANGGKLITIDSYIEEYTNQTSEYRGSSKFLYKDSLGWKNINFLIDHFGLRENIIPCVGWSPDDNRLLIEKYLPNGIDFSFIDGGHFPEQIIKDVNSIIPYLTKNAVIVFHDYYDVCFTEEVKNFLLKNFNKLPHILVDHIEGDNLAMIQI